MPHIVAKHFHHFDTPVTKEGYRFLWFARPLVNAKDELVAVEYDKKPFLLTIKPKRDGTFVIKGDKITRLSPTVLMKMALKNFCDLAQCDVLYDNLSTIKTSHAQKAREFLKEIDFFIEQFPKNKEVWIEIGFGSGRHLLYQAQQHPDTIFIGIEIHKPSVEQVLKQIALKDLKNLYIIDYDARLFLEFVPSNVVGKIFVHFPVPWDKKPHRRVFSKPFIEEAKRVLKVDGVLELRTDSINYFEYALDLLLQEKKVKFEVAKNIEPPVSSKYEDRWTRLGKDIYDIRMFNLEFSEQPILHCDFSFETVSYDESKLEQLHFTPQVYDNFFVHFEKLYAIENGGKVIRLSFGSFDRPEHKYLVFKDGNISYFPKKPVLSKANVAAHKKILELLHG
ncbi:tRNA (guanosine(46)-N7)-methyltransferase TrmB [Nitratiruptor sp. SB155-2]|uniref:tRNA (guanosine(46)-N7)-methyltransferase TrmB n=1 Tax=Nitratiruptor sp. (strain SB155-2) TaxID=387092 RepID=UPI000158737A|nr:tRNA (guanosine(46)-N7)-methyltransferase TrmB [Nitratiruptor sp. SB155-2]BAF69866.1 tRNA (guanine-N(7)-)-methyltransferase [Nitratiruptor sp. SB155-2]